MSKQQLEEIINNAPRGATHVSNNGVYYGNSNEQTFGCLVWWQRGEEWIESSIDHITRSLSDLQSQLDQLNEIGRLKSALHSTNEDLNYAIEMYNREVQDPCKFLDVETCFENAKLLEGLTNE